MNRIKLVLSSSPPLTILTEKDSPYIGLKPVSFLLCLLLGGTPRGGHLNNNDFSSDFILRTIGLVVVGWLVWF